VRRVLLDDACLEGGLFDPDGLRRVVDGHLAGRRNHTYLIMAMMIVELGRQLFATDWALAASGIETSGS
jgi:hypothetical protein